MSKQRVIVLVDGARLNAMGQMVGCYVDYTKFLNWVGRGGDEVISALYATQLPSGEHPLYKRLDWLANNGWKLVSKEASERKDNETGEYRMIGSMDTHVVAECCRIAYTRAADRVYLVSGSGDIVPGVEALQSNGIDVKVIGVMDKGTDRPYVAPALRRVLSGRIIELADIAEDIRMDRRDAA